MDGRSSTAEPKHSYHSASFAHLVSATPNSIHQASHHPANEASSPIFVPHVDIFPILFPPQSAAFHAAQLLNYNKLVAPGRGRGGGLQNSPLPAALPNGTYTHTGPRSRSSSKVSNKDVPASKPSGNPSCHGNRGPKNADKAERAVIAGKESAAAAAVSKMPPKTTELAHPLPSRPARPQNQPHPQTSPRAPAQASSVPSTPHQHARNFSFESREPSPNATQNHSPRSTYSDPNGNLTSLRPLPPRLGGCVFETALVRGRRRMPYNIGGDRLEPVPQSKIKSKLSEDEERKLTTDMRELYDRLKPTEKIKGNRDKLVKKLDKIFNDEWPGHNIKVHLFGSSGNKLCSDDSDLDICITTDWKELENVCIIADLLAHRGMEKVVCVSSAKVPIVKIWDPELSLACDMNVNNTLALENTRMVLTYVDIDERVRPLAMIIKYWTRRRIINDAAFGGTLSSYTWICMIIAFLQLRDPPVLPALHQSPHKKGQKSDFADDLSKLKGFGHKNKETLGELLFHFFRFYAHTFDYDKWVLSIRLGRKLTKTEKKWHLALNNALCVEEPFNTIRNLGNTADDTSFRGLHLEMRRAFDLIAEAKLEECCEEYVFPKEEERVWQKPAPAPRPVLVRSSSQQHSNRGGRGTYRGGGRHRGSNRRASSSVAYENNPVMVQPSFQTSGTGVIGQDGQWYTFATAPLSAVQASQAQQPQAAAQAQAAQAQYAFVSPDAMFNPALYQLGFDNPGLRFQMYTQSQQYAHQQALANMQRLNGSSAGGSSQATDRSRAGSFDQPPLSAPLRPADFSAYVYPQMPLGQPYYAQTGFTTYPSSPSTTTGAPEFRRSLHRNSVTGETGSSRSQSQPASRSPMPPTTTTQGGVSAYPTSSLPAAVAAATANGIPMMPRGVGVGLGIGDIAATANLVANGNHGINMAPVQARQVHGVPISFMPSDDAIDTDVDEGGTKSLPDSPPDENARTYAGYYLSDGPGTGPVKKTPPNGIPSFGDLGRSPHARRRLSTDQTPQSILDRRMKRTSRSPSPLGGAGSNHTRAMSVGGACSAPLGSTATFPQYGAGTSKLSVEARPIVVSGSGSMPTPSPARSSRQPSATSESINSDLGSANGGTFDNPLHITNGLRLVNGHTSPAKPVTVEPSVQSASAPLPDRPLVVNGTTSSPAAPVVVSSSMQYAVPDAKSFNQRIAAMTTLSPASPIYRVTGAPEVGSMSAYPQYTPAVRLARYQPQSGVIAPLDLAIADNNTLLPDFQHLSPVYENRTPSPTATRKFEASQAAHGFFGASSGLSEVYSPQDFPPEQPSGAFAAAASAQFRKGILQQPDATVSPKQETARVNGHAAKESVSGGSGQSRVPPRIDTGAASGWQQKTKGRKKPGDIKNLTNGSSSSQSEQVPKNEADRKGG